jgi:hypothetical protein
MCFDVAHARQVDTTMTESYRILKNFKERIAQIHISGLTSASKHERLSDSAIESFREVALYMPYVPVILESPVAQGMLVTRLGVRQQCFQQLSRRPKCLAARAFQLRVVQDCGASCHRMQ